MKNLKHILLITISYSIITGITGCKRECLDDRADNYKEGHRKDNCDYSHADNWYKEIIVDSILINGVYEEEEFNYIDAPYLNTEYNYENEVTNSITWRIDLDKQIGEDTINSVSYNFGVPVADDFEESLGKFHFRLDGLEFGEGISRGGDLNSFEQREINGIKYYFFELNFKNIKNETQITKENFESCRSFIYVYYLNPSDINFKVKYQINLLKND